MPWRDEALGNAGDTAPLTDPRIDDLTLRYLGGMTLEPSGGSIRVLGADIGPGLSMSEHVRRKCAVAQLMAHRLRWIM